MIPGSEIKAKFLVAPGCSNITKEYLKNVNFFDSIVINDKRIIAISPQEELADTYSSSDEIELNDHILIPGLINAHGHAPMTLLRGIADDSALDEWLSNKIWPLEQKFVDEQFVADGTELAISLEKPRFIFPSRIALRKLKADERILPAVLLPIPGKSIQVFRSFGQTSGYK